MKVLLVSQYFWPESFLITSIVSRLVQEGHEVDVLTGKPNYPQGVIYQGYRAWGCSSELHGGALIHRVPLAPRGRGGLRLALNYLSFILSGMVFGPFLLRGRRADVIFVYAPSPLLQAFPAILLGRIKRCPVVVWVQDLWPQSLSATGHVRNKTALWLVEKAVRFIYRHSKLLLVQSEAFVQPVSRLAPATDISYLPNSVSDSFAADQAKAGGTSGGFTVLFAGNLGSAQAVDCILLAAEQLRGHPDIGFSLVGDGSRRQYLLEEVARRRLANVALPGRFPVEAMPQMMQQASVLLVTLSAQEIFEYTVPSKVQAYMAAGRPIIAAINGEGARIVREAGVGIAVPAEDGQALAQAILRMRDMPASKREAFGAAGRAYYMAHYREEILLGRLLEHLGRVAIDGKEN